MRYLGQVQRQTTPYVNVSVNICTLEVVQVVPYFPKRNLYFVKHKLFIHKMASDRDILPERSSIIQLVNDLPGSQSNWVVTFSGDFLEIDRLRMP